LTGSEPGARLCAACRSRECCGGRPVIVRPDEAARIARTLAIPLGEVVEVAAFDAPAGPGTEVEPRAFRLAPGGPPHALLLRKAMEPDGLACRFRLALRTGRKLCGLGPLAPLACRRFPHPNSAEAFAAGHCWRVFTPSELESGARAVTDDGRVEAPWGDARTRWHEAVDGYGTPVPGEVFLDWVLNAFPLPVETP
jgi:hypothetical protein